MFLISGSDYEVTSQEILSMSVNPKELDKSIFVIGTAASMQNKESIGLATEKLGQLGFSSETSKGVTRSELIEEEEENLKNYEKSKTALILDGSQIHFLSCFKQTKLSDAIKQDSTLKKVVVMPINIATTIGGFAYDARGGAFTFGLEWIPGIIVVDETQMNDRTVSLLPKNTTLIAVDKNSIWSLSKNDLGIEIGAYGTGKIVIKSDTMDEVLDPGQSKIIK